MLNHILRIIPIPRILKIRTRCLKTLILYTLITGNKLNVILPFNVSKVSQYTAIYIKNVPIDKVTGF